MSYIEDGKKALFLDLDGTLLNDKKEITPGNFHAICQALAEGHKIVITTGRPLASGMKQAEHLGLTSDGCYLIAFNGGVIYDMGNEKVIAERTISLGVVGELFREANQRRLHIQTYVDDVVLVEEKNDNETVRRYCRTIKMKYRTIDKIARLYDEPPKLLAIDDREHQPLEEFRKWIEMHCADMVDCFFSSSCYLEIVPKGMNKGTALLNLAAALRIPIKNTIAVGDEANDIPMIQAAHLGVCMENGIEAAKEAADYVTLSDNNQDGVAEVIQTFMLEK